MKAAIFDLDGLLVDTEAVWREALESVMATIGVALDTAHHEQVRGMQIKDKVSTLLPLFSWPADRAAELAHKVDIKAAESIVSRSVLKAGVGNALDVVESLGWQLAVASGSPMRIIEAQLENFGLKNRFGALCSTHDEVRGKPDPAVFLRAAERLKVRASDCVVLEDAPSGVRAAIAARMAVVAVPEGPPAEVLNAGAGTVLHSLENLTPSLLTGLFTPSMDLF